MGLLAGQGATTSILNQQRNLISEIGVPAPPSIPAPSLQDFGAIGTSYAGTVAQAIPETAADAGTGVLGEVPSSDASVPAQVTGLQFDPNAFAQAASSLTSNEPGVLSDIMQAASSGGQNEPLGPQYAMEDVSQTASSGSSGGSGNVFLIGLAIVGAVVAFVYYRKHHHAHAGA